MIGVAVIGTGWMGEAHALSYMRNAKTKLVCVADVIEELAKNVAEKAKADYYTTNYKEIFEDDSISTVSVVTPNFTHYEIAKDCLKNGRNVLVEKPIALKIEHAKELIDIAKETNVKLMVGHAERFHIGFMTAKQNMEKIGKVYLAQGRWMHRAPKAKGWVWDVKKSGGTIVDLGTHIIDLFRWFFNSEVKRVYAEYSTALFEKEEGFEGEWSEDTAKIMLRFENDVIASVDVTRALAKKYPSVVDISATINGTEGVIDVDSSLGLPCKIYAKGRVVPDVIRTPKYWIAEEIESFVDAIENNTEPLCSGYDGLKALEVALAARESAEKQEVIEL